MEDTGGAEPEQRQPINFGKRLAHTDKPVRDRAFKSLRKWLEKHPELSHLEYMKLWRGLYFGMWMADKRMVQQELSVNTALLIGCIPRGKRALWFGAFLETMKAEWEKLDKHRISKYLLFMRIVLAEVFKHLRDGSWETKEVAAVSTLMFDMGPEETNDADAVPAKHRVGLRSPGVLLQLVRVFWDELLPQLEAAVPSGGVPGAVAPEVRAAAEGAALVLLRPFCDAAAASRVDNLVRSIHERVLRKAPVAIALRLAELVLSAAARGDIPKENRQALYDTAGVLERLGGGVQPGAKGTTDPVRVALGRKDAPAKAVQPDACLPEKKSRRKKGKRKAAAAPEAPDTAAASETQAPATAQRAAPMSPLELPPPADPAGEVAGAPGKKQKKKRKAPEAAQAASGDAPGEAAAAPAEGKQKKRRVTIDLGKTEVIKYRLKDAVAR